MNFSALFDKPDFNEEEVREAVRRGEAAEVSFRLTDDVLGYTRRDGRRVCDKGEYRLWIGG